MKKSGLPFFWFSTNDFEKIGSWEDYLEMGENALRAAEFEDQQDEVFNISLSLAKVYSNLNQKQRALDYYQMALKCTEKLGDKILQASILNNIGTTYANLSQNYNALQFLEEARAILVDINDPFIKANVYNNLGQVEIELGNHELAIEILNLAIDLIPQIQDDDLLIKIYFNLSMAHYSRGDLSESVLPLRRAVELERKNSHVDYDRDIKFLSKMEKDLARPRVIRWIHRIIT